MTPALGFAAVCAAALAVGTTAWVAPVAESDAFSRRDAGAALVALAVGVSLRPGSIDSLQIFIFLLGVFLTVKEWRRIPNGGHRAFQAAFAGVGYFMLTTTRDWRLFPVAVVLWLGAPHVGRGLLRHSHRRIALTLLAAATLFQLGRVPRSLAG